MKICCFSDNHGFFDFKIKSCDIVLICGDIIPLILQRNISFCIEWFKSFFIPFCQELPCKKVIFVGGNHDFFLDEKSDEIKEILSNQDKIIYLNRDLYTYENFKIYGTPLCHIYGHWGFMIPDSEQEKIYQEELNKLQDVDIVISHDSPYGVSDVLSQTRNKGKHIGNIPLSNFIKKLQPKYHFHGHLHSTNHNEELLDNTKVYNVSLLDDYYNVSYDPLYIEI